MASPAIKLPEGYQLDQPPTQPVQPKVPAGYTLDDNQTAGQLTGFAGPVNVSKNTMNTMVDYARPVASQVVGDAAATLAAPTAPFTAGAGPVVAYGGAYSLTDALMQYLKTEKPEYFSSALGTGALNAGLSKVLGLVSKGAVKTGKAVLNADQPEFANFLPTAGQALEKAGFSKLGGAATALEDLAVGAKKEALDRSAGAGFTQALKLAKDSEFYRLENGRVNFSMNPQVSRKIVGRQMGVEEPPDFSAIDAVIKDPYKLEKTLGTAQREGINENLKRTLGGYQFQKMFNDVTTRDLEGNVVRIDPKKISDMWSDPAMQDSLKQLYNSKTRGNIEQFFKNVEATQGKFNPGAFSSRFWLYHGGVGLTMGLFTGSLTGSAEGFVAGTAPMGILLSAQQVGRILSKPEVGRFMVKLAGGEPLNASDQFVGRMISNSLQGSLIHLLNKDGSTTPAVITKDNKLVTQPQ